MAHEFSPEVQQLVKEQMATGLYASEDELLLDALCTLSQRNQDLAAIKAGIEDMEGGRMRPAEEGVDEIRRRHGWSPDA